MPPSPTRPAAPACPDARAPSATHIAAPSSSQVRLLSLLVHLSCGLAGVVTTMLGPLLPSLLVRWRLADAQAGALFTAEFGASIAGVAASGLMLPRYGYIRAIVAGVALMAAGVALLPVGGYAVGIGAVLTFGSGLGLAGPGFSLWVAESQAHRRAAALSVLNMVWALGAAVVPAVIGLLVRRGLLPLFLPGLALVLALVAVSLMASRRAGGDPVPVASPSAVPRPPAAFWITAPTPAFAGFLFVYVGVEQALSGWAATVAQRFGGAGAGSVAMVPSFFWAALVVGRGLAPLLLRRLQEATVAFSALAVAAAGTIALLLASTPAAVTLAVTLAGLGLAPMFPMAVSLLTQRFGALAARVAGPLFAMGSLGSALLPWLVGLVSSRGGGLRAGLGLMLAGVLVLCALYARLARSLSAAAVTVGQTERTPVEGGGIGLAGK